MQLRSLACCRRKYRNDVEHGVGNHRRRSAKIVPLDAQNQSHSKQSQNDVGQPVLAVNKRKKHGLQDDAVSGLDRASKKCLLSNSGAEPERGR